MLKTLIGGIALLLSWSPMLAADNTVPDSVGDALKILVPDITPDSIAATPVPGIYEALYGTQVVYLSADGRYFIRGDILDTVSRENLTENRKNAARKKLIAQLDEKKMLIYGPEQPKRILYVFTDIDCPYCAKLHLEVPELNKAGVQVRYLAYPRAGVGSPSYRKYVSVYCADDPLQALTDAKAGRIIPAKQCDNPVQEHFELGRSMGVSGTPTIFVDDGSKFPGYLPAKVLLAELGLQKAQ